MKVKIFSNTDIGYAMQKEMNIWLESKKPEIKFIQQSEAYGEEHAYSITISIWYED